MVSGRNGTNPEFPEQPYIASLFPGYESDTDASSEYNQIPPNFSHHKSRSIASIFSPFRSPSNVSEISETTLDHSVASFRNYMKQKIVMKVQMNCQKCQTKALTVAAEAKGVKSVRLEGAAKDKVVVIGDEVDAASLARTMRKKVGYTDIISVAEVNLGL